MTDHAFEWINDLEKDRQWLECLDCGFMTRKYIPEEYVIPEMVQDWKDNHAAFTVAD